MHSGGAVQINPIRMLLKKRKFGAKGLNIKTQNTPDKPLCKGRFCLVLPDAASLQPGIESFENGHNDVTEQLSQSEL